MWFIYFILILLFSLLFIVVKSSVLNLGFLFISKEKVSTEKLVFPVLLSLILFVGLISLATLILSRFGLSLFIVLSRMALKLNYSLRDLGYIILAYIFSIIAYLIIQGFILKLINIPYYRLYKKLKNILSKKYRNEKPPVDIVKELTELKEEKVPLSYFQYFVIGLFAFAIIFFCITTLEFIGVNIGEMICNKWIK